MRVGLYLVNGLQLLARGTAFRVFSDSFPDYCLRLLLSLLVQLAEFVSFIDSSLELGLLFERMVGLYAKSCNGRCESQQQRATL